MTSTIEEAVTLSHTYKEEEHALKHVPACMERCQSVCVCACACVCVCVCVCVALCVYACMARYKSVCVRMCMCVGLCLCMHTRQDTGVCVSGCYVWVSVYACTLASVPACAIKQCSWEHGRSTAATCKCMCMCVCEPVCV